MLWSVVLSNETDELTIVRLYEGEEEQPPHRCYAGNAVCAMVHADDEAGARKRFWALVNLFIENLIY